MSSAIDKLKKKASGKLFAKLMEEIHELREEQEKTNDLLEEILKEVKE